jgi:hypothetical protein
MEAAVFERDPRPRDVTRDVVITGRVVAHRDPNAVDMIRLPNHTKGAP